MMKLILLLLAALPAVAAAAVQTLYVGTFTSRGTQTAAGIYVADFDDEGGTLARLRLAAALPDPSWVLPVPARDRLYAVSAVPEFEGRPVGAVAAFAIGPDGTLRLLNRRPAEGHSPCHLALTPDGGHLIVSNYRGQNVAVLPLAYDGSLRPASQVVPVEGTSVHPHRQRRSHPHAVNFSPDGRMAVVSALGADRLFQFAFDPVAGALRPLDASSIATPAGAGPRHFAFHPALPVAYSLHELHNTVGVFALEAAGPALRLRGHVLALPEEFHAASTAAEVVVHPSGRFAYASNRGHDSIAVFAVDAVTGDLSPRGHAPSGGRTPRNFTCDPSGRWLLAANQDDDTITVFAIDPQTGALTPQGRPFAAPTPTCLRFAAHGR